MFRILISTASGLALLAGVAHAQDGVTVDEEGVTRLEIINVTANRTPTEQSRTGSKVERVTPDEIETKSLISVTDYLTRLPGISFSSYGGYGTLSNLSIRGMPGGYVKTFYNGIDVSDTATTQIQADYGHLMIGGITGVEVLKGSQGTLYGSNAVAGVVDITTLGQIDDGISHTVHVEGGSFGTVRGRYGFTAIEDGSKVAANLSGFRTDGISSMAGGSERDGYDNVTFDLAAEHRINDAFSVFGSLLYVDAKFDFDSSGPDDSTTQGTAEITSGRFGFNLDLLDGRWKHTLSAQAFKMQRDSTDAAPWLSIYEGTRQKLDYQSSFEVTDRVLLQYGADHERQSADTTAPDFSAWPTITQGSMQASTNVTGVWAQANFEPIDDLVLTAGLRHDEHSEFGGYTNWRGTASYLLGPTGTRFHSSYGTGFRAPSLFELYDPAIGNLSLQPETSRSFDIGVEQKFFDGSLTTDLTYFWAEVEDLITWDAVQYQQLPGITRSQGIEAAFSYAVTNWLDLGGSYTYTDSKQASGARRSNLPRHVAVLSASVRPAERWTVSGDLKFVADTVEGTNDLKDYVLLNAKVAYQVNEATELYLRGENLLDQDYEIRRGYNTRGIAAYAGFKAKF